MRHFLLPRPIAPGPRRMLEAATTARLITATGQALRDPPSLSGAALRTINIAAITTATDQHLGLAKGTEKEARRDGVGLSTVTWTNGATGEILPPHTCSARCGARR